MSSGNFKPECPAPNLKPPFIRVIIVMTGEHVSEERTGYKMADITYEIKETIGVISKSAKDWTKELNLVSWNGREPKYDVREWAPDHAKMGKGLTFTKEEMEKLRDLLNGIKNS
jgi:hypothetical protein